MLMMPALEDWSDGVAWCDGWNRACSELREGLEPDEAVWADVMEGAPEWMSGYATFQAAFGQG